MSATLSQVPIQSIVWKEDFRIGGHWLDPQLDQYSFQGLMMAIATRFILLTAFHCFDDGNVGKQQGAWKEYCAKYW